MIGNKIIGNELIEAGGTTFSGLLASYNPDYWWRLGEASGNFADSGSAGAAMIATGMTYGAAGALLTESDDAATFTPTTGYTRTAGTHAPFTGVFTVGCFIKSTAVGSLNRMVSQFTAGGDQVSLYGNTALNTTTFRVNGNILAGSTVIVSPANVYHFIVGTRDGSNDMRLYVDGALDAGPAAGAGAPTTTDLELGFDNAQGLGGDLDEAFILVGTALSAAQVAELYAAAGY